MKRVLLLAALGWVSLLAAPTTAVAAETVFRYDEVPVGELDPMKAIDVADSILFYNVYDTVVFPAVDGSGSGLKPHLAEKVDIDGTTVTITLRPNVKFHSGNVMEAEDLVFSLKRMLALNKGFAFLFSGWIQDVSAKDGRTAVVKLTKPYAPFYTALVRLVVLDRKTVMANKEPGNYGEFGDYGEKFLNTKAAGTGAYRIVSHDPKEATEMRKFDGYFLGVPKKAPDVVRAKYGVIDPTLLTLVRRGEHDLVNQWVTPETKKALAEMKEVKILAEPGIAQFFIKLNTKKAPLDDVHCRRALAYSFDYASLHGIETISATVKGAKPAKGPLVETMLGFDPTMPDFARDLAKAKAELAQCKYKPADHTLEITWIAEVAKEERIALLMQQNWIELGFKAQVVRTPWVLFIERVSKPETTPHVGQLYFNARTPDPDAYIYNVYHSSAAAANLYPSMERLNDPEVDRLLDLGRTTSDPAKRADIYKQVSRRIVDLMPSIYGYQVINLWPKRDVVTIPTLEKPNMNTGLMGGNILFRLMEMKDAG